MSNRISIDFSVPDGRVKPVHGLCNGPICESGVINLSKYYKEIGVPSVRLHDTDGANSRFYVDVSRIFPDFGADENDPENYFFERTDRLLLAIQALGAEIIYRLGESIDHDFGARYAAPPKDFDKWVRVALHIIRHYNEGWADGYSMNIKYWEIWNEAEGINEHGIRCNWRGGTVGQVFELYRKAAAAIKAYDPGLKVGGLAFCDGDRQAALDFIRFCRDNSLPLDFLSYHGYMHEVGDISAQAFRCRRRLDDAGFEKTQIIFDEWNYIGFERSVEGDVWMLIRNDDTPELRREVHQNQKNMVGASFDAAALIAMNSCPIDIADYYDGQCISNWCGLFDTYAVPQKTFYAFRAYGRVFAAAPEKVRSSLAGDNLYCLAARGNNARCILLSSFRGDETPVELNLSGLGEGKKKAVVFLLDQAHDLSPDRTEYYTASEVTQILSLPRYGVALIEITDL